jgi:hypothetical protein
MKNRFVVLSAFLLIVFLCFFSCSKSESTGPAETKNSGDVKTAETVPLDSLVGSYVAKIGKDSYTHVLSVSTGGDGQDGPEVLAMMGLYFSDQKPDWLNIPPERVTKKDGKITFTVPVSGDGTEGEFLLSREGKNLKGTCKIKGSETPVLFEFAEGTLPVSEKGAESASDKPNGKGFITYGLGKKYAKELKDPKMMGAAGIFSNAYSLEGQVVLEFDDGRGKISSYYCSDPGDTWSRMFYAPGEGPVEDLLNKTFAIQYTTAKREDERGEKVDVRVPASIVQADKKKFDDFGIENAFNLYDFITQAQEVVRSDNAELMAQIISLPLTMTAPDGEVFTLEFPEEIPTIWNDLFNGKVKNALMNQKYEDLFVNSKGIMIGSGELWFAPVEGDEYALIAINPF